MQSKTHKNMLVLSLPETIEFHVSSCTSHYQLTDKENFAPKVGLSLDFTLFRVEKYPMLLCTYRSVLGLSTFQILSAISIACDLPVLVEVEE